MNVWSSCFRLSSVQIIDVHHRGWLIGGWGSSLGLHVYYVSTLLTLLHPQPQQELMLQSLTLVWQGSCWFDCYTLVTGHTVVPGGLGSLGQQCQALISICLWHLGL